MTNKKLQIALDELERLRDTVNGFKKRNGTLPDADSDAARALSSIRDFSSKLHKLEIGHLVEQKRTVAPFSLFFHWCRQLCSTR